MKKTARRASGHSAARTLGFGVLANIILCLLFALIAAAVLEKIKDPLGGLGIASMLTFFPTAVISGFMIPKFKGDGGTFIAFSAALTFVLLLFICSAITTRGNIPISTILSYLAYVVLEVIGSMLGKRRTTHRHVA